MRRTIGLLILLAAGALPVARATTFTDRTLARPEGPRHYIVADPGGPAVRPLIILLHGHGESAATTVGRDTLGGYRPQDWARLAEREHLLLIAPEGSKGSDGKTAWNDCRADAPTNATTDDVGFIAALIDLAVAQYGADPGRVYVFGSSNGGGMAYRLGIEIAPRLAGIGAQSALMPARSRCRAPTQPLPVFISHGTADGIAPYAGGEVHHLLVRGRGSGIGADATVALWRRLAGLPDAGVSDRFPHLHADDPTAAVRTVWGTDPSGLQVAFLRIDGGGHIHASRDESLPWLLGKILGPMNHDVTTADEAWRFFKDKRAGAGPR